jgi:hypothetical protein
MCGKRKQCTCSLVLEDGTVFTGESFGAEIPVDGEVGKLLLYFVVFIFISIMANCENAWSRGGNVRANDGKKIGTVLWNAKVDCCLKTPHHVDPILSQFN